MIEVLTEATTPPHLRKAGKGRDVRYAVAFWGKGASKKLGLDEAGGGRIICNLESGCTNPDEIKHLLSQGFEIRTHAKLHGKLYMTDRSAVVGSSNASLNGLAVEGDLSGWREINLATDDKSAMKELAARFDALWRQGLPVDAKLAESFRAAWRRRQKSAKPPVSRSFLAAVGENPFYFEAQSIWFVMTKEHLHKDVVDEIKHRVQEGEGGERAKAERYWSYVEYPDFQKDAWIIDVMKVRKAKVHGFARTFDKRVRITLGDGDRAQLAFPRPAISLDGRDYKLEQEDKDRIASKWDDLWSAGKGDDEYRMLPLASALPFLIEHS